MPVYGSPTSETWFRPVDDSIRPMSDVGIPEPDRSTRLNKNNATRARVRILLLLILGTTEIDKMSPTFSCVTMYVSVKQNWEYYISMHVVRTTSLC